MSVFDASEKLLSDSSFLTPKVPGSIDQLPSRHDRTSAQREIIQHGIQTLDSHRGLFVDETYANDHGGGRYGNESFERPEQRISDFQSQPSRETAPPSVISVDDIGAPARESETTRQRIARREAVQAAHRLENSMTPYYRRFFGLP